MLLFLFYLYYKMASAVQQRQMPKDAIVIVSILKELGITDYEPRVINQLLEFTYSKYCRLKVLKPGGYLFFLSVALT